MIDVPQTLTEAEGHHRAGRQAEAERLCRAVLTAEPDNPQAMNLLGGIAMKVGRHDVAAALFARVLTSRPNAAFVHRNLGQALMAQGRWPVAVACLERAVGLWPGDAPLRCDLGMALLRLDRPEEAAQAFADAVALLPEASEPHTNLGVALERLGRVDAARIAYERALMIKPDLLQGFKNWQLICLLAGRFEEGWDPARFREIIVPKIPGTWDGSDPAGRTLLVYNIEGFGDVLNFLRYLPILAARGARVILEVEPELIRLVRGLPDVAVLITRGEPRPAFDAKIFFQQIPHALGTVLATIPADVPYLRPDPGLVSDWAARLGDRRGLRVGLVWAGSVGHPRDAQRTVALSAFAPLGAVPGVTFYALQKGPAAAQAADPPAGMTLVDLGPDIADFADSAAVVANLDLVVAVDTSVVHLAGAIAAPVWCLIARAPDFRWLIDREDSPWYPTLRLFRQTERNDWAPVIERVAADLGRLAAGDRSVLAPRRGA